MNKGFFENKRWTYHSWMSVYKPTMEALCQNHGGVHLEWTSKQRIDYTVGNLSFVWFVAMSLLFRSLNFGENRLVLCSDEAFLKGVTSWTFDKLSPMVYFLGV